MRKAKKATTRFRTYPTATDPRICFDGHDNGSEKCAGDPGPFDETVSICRQKFILSYQHLEPVVSIPA